MAGVIERTGGRLTLTADGVVVGADRPFFVRHPMLVEHARRARREAPGTVEYYWLDDDAHVLRVTIEVASGNGGATAMLQAHRASPPPWGLTTREHQVLSGLAAGMTNAEIAEWLDIARRTVATHVEHLLAKLEVPTRSAAVAAATAEQCLLAPFPPMLNRTLGRLGRVLGTGQVSRPAVPPPPAVRRPIRLGSIYPVRGARRLDALAMRRGATVAVQQINTRGGVAGRTVEHIVMGVSGDRDEDIITSVGRLLDSEVDAITLGNVDTLAGMHAVDLVAEARVPLLHSMVAPSFVDQVSGNLTRLGQTFQVCATETAYVSGFLRTLNHLVDAGQWRPARRSVAVVGRADAGADLRAVTDQAAGQSAWDVESFIPVPAVGAPWDRVVETLERVDPAAVLVCTYIEDELRHFLEALGASAISPLIYTVWTPTIPGCIERMGPLAEGLVWSTVVGMYDDPLSMHFLGEYQRMFGGHAGTGSAAIHFDMVHMLSSAWAQTDRPWDFGSVVRGLRQTVFRGVAGPYFFGGPGQRALAYPDDTPDASLGHAHLVHQVQGGRSRVIAPAEIAGGQFVPVSSTH
jgi:branched-chain amino acid transport system substrate-binding protein